MKSDGHIVDRSLIVNNIGHPSTHTDYLEDFDNNQFFPSYLSIY